MAQKAVFLKLSGERLAKDGLIWHSDAQASTGQKIADTYKARKELALSAITIISGAGNIARGENLRHIFGPYADAIGRMGTIKNTAGLSIMLDRLKIPNVMMLAAKMGYKDLSLKLESYSPEAAHRAHSAGKVVLIAGGTGEDHKTTDSAVVFYARDYRKVSQDEIVILKGTQVDGVYTGNPLEVADAKRLRKVGAKQMLENYDNYKVVDRSSLQQLANEDDLSMFVYKENEHSVNEILRTTSGQGNGEVGIGTIIVPNLEQPTYY